MKIYGISLAAGFGTRLLPLTGMLPKPLIPLCGETILSLAVKNLLDAGAEQVVVNTHHLGEKIENYLNDSPFREKVRIYKEERILGTGGPFVNAKEFLSQADVILLQNADVVCNFDLNKLLDKHCNEGNLATMVLIDGPENRVLYANGKVRDILGKLDYRPFSADAKQLTYACVMAISPRLFQYLPKEPEFCSIISGILDALRAHPDSIGAFLPSQTCFWSDIGSFDQYFDTHKAILCDHTCPVMKQDSPIYHGTDFSVGDHVQISGFLSAGNHCRIGDHAVLSNCILLDDTHVPDGEYHAQEILGPGFCIHKDQKQIVEMPLVSHYLPDIRISSIAEQGSNRKFRRISSSQHRIPSSILMISSPDDADFDRFIEIGKFCNHNHLHTPELYSWSERDYSVLMEDLGNDTVYDIGTALLKKGDCNGVESLYRKVLEALVDFQVRGTKCLQHDGMILRPFDYEYLRWETNYFCAQFVQNLCALQLTQKELDGLTWEFRTLANENLAMPQTLMHRDFQSQNILIARQQVRFVDYQGARVGPCLYDMMSFLKDPYLILSDPMRETLRRYHCELLTQAGFVLSDELHLRYAMAAGLQRNLQCLGAYGFLSLSKGKNRYLDYALPGLAYLKDTLQTAGQFDLLHFPLLSHLVLQLEEVLPHRIQSIKESTGNRRSSCLQK